MIATILIYLACISTLWAILLWKLPSAPVANLIVAAINIALTIAIHVCILFGVSPPWPD